jgi:hypothetical protein
LAQYDAAQELATVHAAPKGPIVEPNNPAAAHGQSAELSGQAPATGYAHAAPLGSPALAKHGIEPEAGEPVAAYARVTTVNPYLALRRERDARRVDVSSREATEADELIEGTLNFNDRVFVLQAFPHNWVQVRTDDGKTGYVDQNRILMRPPEPTAQLYKTQSGDTALGIAQETYSCGEWGKDGRFFTNALVHVNQGRSDGSGIYKSAEGDSWQDAKVKAGHWIWLPDQAFLSGLSGVESGSISHKAVQTGTNALAFVTGWHQGLGEALADLFTDAVELVSLIWDAMSSLLGGSLLSDIKAFIDELAELSAESMVGAFLDRWNNPDPYAKWNFRGWLSGFAVMTVAIEILLAVFTGGTGNAARWAGKAGQAGKLAKWVKGTKLGRTLAEGVETIAAATPDLKQITKLVSPKGKGKTPAKFHQGKRIEAKVLMEQGLSREEAFEQIRRFDAGEVDDYGFHFTNAKGGQGIVDSGEMWATQKGVAGKGVYMGTTPTPNIAQKYFSPIGWGVNPGSNVRIPLKMRPDVKDVSRTPMLPRWTTVVGDGENIPLKAPKPGE